MILPPRGPAGPADISLPQRPPGKPGWPRATGHAKHKPPVMKELSQETRRAIHVATLASAAMIAQQIAGKAVRDGLFLSNFPATDLPAAMIGGALLSFGGALVLSSVLARFGPHRTVPGLFAASAVVFLVFGAFYHQAPTLITVLLYLHMASFGILVISAFWSLINELFDPHTAKLAVTRIVTGSTFGGVCGGILADQLTGLDGPGGMFFLLAGLHSLCAIVLSRMKGHDSGERQMPSALRGFAVIRRSSYLKQIALAVALASGVAALLDYTMKAEAAKQYLDEDSLVSFFAAFYTGTSVLAFLLQRLLADTTLRQIGLSATMSILPVAAIAGSLFGALFTRLPTVVAAKGAEVILANSFFRSGVELVYTPVPPSRKRSAKSIVDVFAQRAGDLLGGGWILIVLAIAPLMTQKIVLISTALVAILSVVVITRLKRGYVAQLTESLKRGLVPEGDTEEALAEPIDDLAGASNPEPLLHDPATPPDLIETTQALISGNPMQQRRALTAPNIDPRVASLITPLLADQRLKKTATAALENLGDRITGQLADALLDPEQPKVVRLQLTSLIESLGGTRSAHALVLALETTPFPIRYACGQALARLTMRAPELAPSPQRIFAMAARELTQTPPKAGEEPSLQLLEKQGIFEAELAERAGPRLEHIFTLLALVLDREAVEIALRGWLSADRRMHGTAVEYFDNVLPEELRSALARHQTAAKDPAEGDGG